METAKAENRNDVIQKRTNGTDKNSDQL